MFLGPCDEAVGKWISARVTSAQGRQFIYWLTLNSHLPVVGRAMTTHSAVCAELFPAYRDDVCDWASAQRTTMETLSALPAAVATQRTSVLIVGDHRPPFLQRHDREAASTSLIPYLLFTRVSDDAAK